MLWLCIQVVLLALHLSVAFRVVRMLSQINMTEE